MKGLTPKDKKKNKKATGKPNGNAKRNVLRAGNRAYNLQRKSKTKLRRMAAGTPGSAQGKHIKNALCQCGGCNVNVMKIEGFVKN